MNIQKFTLFLILFCFLGCSSYQKEVNKQPRVPATENEQAIDSESEDVDNNGPVEDCITAKDHYFRNSDIGIHCTEEYLHFFSKIVAKKAAAKKIRMAAFNMFHLGDNLAFLKDMKLMAKILDQWDLVTAVEIMPMPGDSLKANAKILKMIEDKKLAGQELEKAYSWLAVPGYIRLLKALQKENPTAGWSLLMGSRAEGEGSSGEMAGFFYRGNTVRPIKNSYCPNGAVRFAGDQSANLPELGCILPVPPEKRALMSRPPFIASFRAGSFDFAALGVHSRFRPPMDDKIVEQMQDYVCEGEPCDIAKPDIARYFEVKVVAEAFPNIAAKMADKDILFMGDFNLEISKKSAPIWAKVLKPAMMDGKEFQVTQTQKTSLSIKAAELNSNYDHFIFAPKITTQCNPASAIPYDFTQAAKPAAAADSQLIKAIRARISPAGQKQYREELKAFYQGNPYAPKEAVLQEKIDGMADGPFYALQWILSDHIPVQMECNFK